MAVIYERAGAEDLDLGVGTGTRTNPGGGLMPIHQVNLASFALVASQVYDPGLVTPGIPVALDVTVPGALDHHPVVVTFTGNMDHTLFPVGRVISPDTVRVTIYNVGLVAFNPGSGTLRTLVFAIPT